MPGIDELPADQRAVLALLLRRPRPYAEIATALRLDEDAVRRRAHAALDALGPATIATPDRRAEAADWLLGQRDDAPAALAADEDTRTWAAALRERLAPLAEHELPELPEAAEPPEPAAPTGGPADATPSPARRRSSRRGGAVLLGVLALVAVAGVLAFALTRGGEDSKSSADPPAGTQGTSTTNGNASRVLAQVNLKPPKGAPSGKAIGVVQIALVDGKQSLVAVAQGLKVTKDSSWGIWAEGGPRGRQWLGPFSQGDAEGRVYAQGRLEPNMDLLKYQRLVVSRDSAKTPPKRQGTPYLAGTIDAPAQQGG